MTASPLCWEPTIVELAVPRPRRTSTRRSDASPTATTDSPMSATKIRALTADRDLRDAVRALLAAAPMLRPTLDGDREWREMGGFDCARAFGSVETDACARLWGVGGDDRVRVARVASGPCDAHGRGGGARDTGRDGNGRYGGGARWGDVGGRRRDHAMIGDGHDGGEVD